MERTVQAFHYSRDPVDVPDLHRVIWRNAEAIEAAEDKGLEDLELARHRRDKLREAGEVQRRLAHKQFKKLQDQERRLLRAKRKEKQIARSDAIREINSGRRVGFGMKDGDDSPRSPKDKPSPYFSLDMLSVSQQKSVQATLAPEDQ